MTDLVELVVPASIATLQRISTVEFRYSGGGSSTAVVTDGTVGPSAIRIDPDLPPVIRWDFESDMSWPQDDQPEAWMPPVRGSVCLVVGIPGEPLPSRNGLYTGGPVYLGLWYDTEWGVGLNAQVHGEMLAADVPIRTGWVDFVYTWDVEIGTHSLYYDGQLVTSQDDVPFVLTSDNWMLQRSSSESPTPEEMTGPALMLASFVVSDEVLDADQVAERATALAARYGALPVPGAGAAATPGSGLVRWDEPDGDVTGWVARVAVDEAEGVETITLPPEARTLDVRAALDLADATGLLHLHAVNESGWSTPSEVRF